MKKIKNKIKIFFVTSLGLLFFVAPFFVKAAPIQTSAQLAVSAFVLSSDNKNLPNGQYDIRFSIYTIDRQNLDPYPSNADASARVWQETQTLTISNGLITAYLGSITPFPASLTFSDGDYYLGVMIGDDSEMVPRKKIASVPMAFNSNFLQGKTLGNQADNIPVLTVGGALDQAIQQNINQVGTVTAGTWQGTAVADKYIANTLTGKTYNGVNLSGSNTLTVSADATIDQNLSTNSNVSFISLNLISALPIASGGTGQTTGQNALNALTSVAAAPDEYVLTKDTATGNAIFKVASTGNTYVAGGSLLNLVGNTFSLREGTMTDTKICAYSASVGIVCDTSAGLIGASYDAGTGLQLVGTTFSVASGVMLEGENISLLNNNAGYITSAGTAASLAGLTASTTNLNSVTGLLGTAAFTDSSAYLAAGATAVNSALLENHNAAYFQVAGSYVTGTPWTAMGYITSAGTAASLAGLTASTTNLNSVTGLLGTAAFTDSSAYLTTLAGAVLTNQATPQTIGTTTNRLAKLWATDITASNAITGSVTGNAGGLSTTLIVGSGGTGSTNGSITGTGALALAAGGSNQNVTLTPSGSGYTLLNGNVGIGTTSPAALLDVNGNASINGLMIGKGSGNISTNTAIGHQSFDSNINGSWGVAVGYQALYRNTSGVSDSAFGALALFSNTTGNQNTAMGAESLYANTTGIANSAVGYSALNANVKGYYNSAMGAYALFSNVTGGQNSALGFMALERNVTGDSNSAVGYSALF